MSYKDFSANEVTQFILPVLDPAWPAGFFYERRNYAKILGKENLRNLQNN